MGGAIPGKGNPPSPSSTCTIGFMTVLLYMQSLILTTEVQRCMNNLHAFRLCTIRLATVNSFSKPSGTAHFYMHHCVSAVDFCPSSHPGPARVALCLPPLMYLHWRSSSKQQVVFPLPIPSCLFTNIQAGALGTALLQRFSFKHLPSHFQPHIPNLNCSCNKAILFGL